MALILVLLFIVLLTAIVIEYGYENRVEATFVESAVAEFEAEVAARSAVAAGLSLLSADLNLDVNNYLEGAQVDSFQDAWAMGIAYRPINKAVMQCLISDEYGKLNLNALLTNNGFLTQGSERDTVDGETRDKPQETERPVGEKETNNSPSDMLETEQPNEYLVEALRALFAMRGAQEDPVDAILDWIDADDEARPGGAESDYYGSLDVAYACKNGPLSSVEELLLVRGITPEIFFGNPDHGEAPLTELLTVRGSRRGDLNVNTAARETLEAFGEAFGMSNFAETVMDERESSPFTSIEDIESRGIALPDDGVPVPAGGGNTRQDQGLEPVGSLRPALICSSQVFRIRATGSSGDAAVQIEAYVARNAGGMESSNNRTDEEQSGDASRRRLEQAMNAQDHSAGGEKTFALLDYRVLR